MKAMMEIVESPFARRSRKFRRAVNLYIVIFGFLFLIFATFLCAFAYFPFGVVPVVVGLYGWTHTGRIAVVSQHTITIVISKKLVMIPVGQIRWIAKDVMITLTDNFWLIICRKQEGDLLPRIYFSPNEKAYQLLATFARIGVRLKNVPP
jgi:hypothetical protein